jgi:hypothetical protein
VRPAQCVLRPFVEPVTASPVALCDDDGWAALTATTGAHGPRGATGATGATRRDAALSPLRRRRRMASRFPW